MNAALRGKLVVLAAFLAVLFSAPVQASQESSGPGTRISDLLSALEGWVENCFGLAGSEEVGTLIDHPAATDGLVSDEPQDGDGESNNGPG